MAKEIEIKKGENKTQIEMTSYKSWDGGGEGGGVEGKEEEGYI